MQTEHTGILSSEQVNFILTKAWSLSSDLQKDKPIQELKVSDWDVLNADMQFIFNSPEFRSYKIPLYTGEAIANLVNRNTAKRVRSIYIVILFILIKEDQITDEDKTILKDFLTHRNHFLQKYLNSSVLETELKSYKEPVPEIRQPETNPSPRPPIVRHKTYYWSIALFLVLAVFFILILVQNYHVVSFVYELRRPDYRRISRFAID